MRAGAARREEAPAAAAVAPASGRRTLIVAGMVLLVAASVFAYRSLSAPSAPAVQQSGRIEAPARPAVAVSPAAMPVQGCQR